MNGGGGREEGLSSNPQSSNSFRDSCNGSPRSFSALVVTRLSKRCAYFFDDCAALLPYVMGQRLAFFFLFFFRDNFPLANSIVRLNF